jgi:hypothetical protein
VRSWHSMTLAWPPLCNISRLIPGNLSASRMLSNRQMHPAERLRGDSRVPSVGRSVRRSRSVGWSEPNGYFLRPACPRIASPQEPGSGPLRPVFRRKASVRSSSSFRRYSAEERSRTAVAPGNSQKLPDRLTYSGSSAVPVTLNLPV